MYIHFVYIVLCSNGMKPNAANLAKHDVDLADAILVFDGRPKLTATARLGTEERYLDLA